MDFLLDEVSAQRGLLITGAGEAAVAEPNAELAPGVAEQFAAVTDVTGAAWLALELEATASQTYLAALDERGWTPSPDAAVSLIVEIVTASSSSFGSVSSCSPTPGPIHLVSG